MTLFLRLFAQYRALEREVQALASDKIVLQDRDRWYQGQIDTLTEQATKNAETAVEGARTVTDFIAQYTIGRKVYGVGPEVTERPPQPAPLSAEAVQARDIQEALMSPAALAAMIERTEKQILGTDNDLG